jgi:hypothetical protein
VCKLALSPFQHQKTHSTLKPIVGIVVTTSPILSR